MKKKRRLKKKFVVFLSLYMVVFVSHFSLTTLAKYTSFINSNSNIAVAKWDISIAGDESVPQMVIGDSSTYQDYNLNVESQSEVAVSYSVIISNVPTGMQIKVNDILYDATDGVITINDLGSFNANDSDKVHNHILSFIVPIDIDTINDNVIDIDVIFSQIEI